ncbi:methyltransferase domain-containing protein [Scytonema sp. PRP1]|uniref:methyltransferase domain-containing protein n=1 Tax=Scytonema sp. PRP1 TaxID=3120513 RepID=UPI002FD70AC9
MQNLPSNWEKDYILVSNLSESDLDDNNSIKKVSRLVGENKLVIDFGCATGYLAQLLTKKGCRVTGVEVNSKAGKIAEQYCEQVIVADLDFVSLCDILPEQAFDVAVFGDVLEHLRDPWRVLEQTRRLLKPEGYVVASIPNIAHGAIRLAFLQGQFEYAEVGILDNTHLRFFTSKTVEELFEQAGYIIDVVERTKLPIFSASNLVPPIDKNSFDIKIIEQIEQDKDADTLQFVIRAFPLSLAGKYAALNAKYLRLVEEMKSFDIQLQQNKSEFEQAQIQLKEKEIELERSQAQIQQKQSELERSQAQIQQKQSELEHSQAQIQQKQSELEHSQLQLQQTQVEVERSQSQLQKTKVGLEQTQLQLQQTQLQLQQTQLQLQQKQAELEQSNTTIAAMHTSKFWKLRTLWFKLKEPIIKFFFSLNNKVVLKLQKSSFRQSRSQFTTADIVVGEVLSKKPLVKHSVSVDIIVCVHNALDDVKRCLESVVRYSRMPYSLILVDDGSNEETCQYLKDFARYQGAILIRNEVAKGYTFAANQGLQLSVADYAILLNSDTIVTPNWLDRMIACGESDPQIGIVGPLSNTASWQSIPEIAHQGDWAQNKLPEDMTVADMGRLLAEYSERVYPRIPFLNGFCLMIKRRLIEEIGYFDEATFGAGYGEENDFCLRAGKAGWQLAIADDAYVFHSQSRSYSNERRKLLCQRADQALVAKHGQPIISDGVAVCRFGRVIEGIRARSRVMAIRQKLIENGKSRWEGKRVLFILPIIEPGGGGNVVFQEAAAMQKMGTDVRIANLNLHKATFERSYPEHDLPVIYVEKGQDITEILAEYDAVIATLYKSVDWLEPLTPDTKLPVRGYYVQDFEPYFFSKNSLDYKTAWNSYTRYRDLVRITKTEWNSNIVKQQIGVDCAVVGSSINIDLFCPRRRRDPSWPQRPLRIAAMVRPSSPRRSPELTMEVLEKIYRTHGDNIEIIIFGCDTNDPDFQALPHDFPWRNAGILTRPQLAFLLNEIDIFVDFSSFQAMGLTAMEAMACGVAVIVPEEGGSKSFARHEENSLIVDSSNVAACLTTLNRLVMDEPLRTQIQRQAIADICQYFPEQAAYNILNSLFSA